MTLSQRIQRWFSASKAPRNSARSSRRGGFQPQLESLEDRLVPTAQVTPLAAAPTFGAVPSAPKQIQLTWDAEAGVTHYKISEMVNGHLKHIATVGKQATEFTVKHLKADETYEFQVGAVNRAGTQWAPLQSSTTLSPPPIAPPVTANAVSPTEIDVSWNAVNNASGYVIAESINGAWQQVGSVDSNTLSYAVTGLSASTTCKFEVGVPYYAGIAWGRTGSATTLMGAPVAPSLTATAVSSSEIDLAWNAVSGASSYVIDQWFDGSDGAWEQIDTVPAGTTSYAVTGLNGNTTYFFDVAAADSAGTTWAPFVGATTKTGGTTTTIDNPTTTETYMPVSGTLFGPNGPSYLDVRQGAEGDCWLCASLAEVAARAPQDIQNMFAAEGTATVHGSTVNLYRVRFYDANGNAQYVTVDTELPDGGTYYDHPVNGVLWVALAEKAYAEANGDGYVTSQHVGTDSYDALDGGYGSWGLHAITGLSAGNFSFNPNDVAAAWNAGKFIVLGSDATPASSYIVGGHAYAMVGYDASSSMPFILFNPWGRDADDFWVPGLANQVYGQLQASAAALAANFDAESFAGAATSQRQVNEPPPPVSVELVDRPDRWEIL